MSIQKARTVSVGGLCRAANYLDLISVMNWMANLLSHPDIAQGLAFVATRINSSEVQVVPESFGNATGKK